MSNATGGASVPILLHEVYAAELRIHAITLIFLGYKRLPLNSLTTAEEDDITGELVRSIKLACQDSSSPDWVEHYEVREQTPQNVAGKLGKRRPKIDIEIERHHRGPRRCLGFEAKCLGRNKRIGDYLGSDGLGRFLRGHYPTTHGDAGMLGYVQEKTAVDWCNELTQTLVDDKCQLLAGGQFKPFNETSPFSSWCSSHSDDEGQPLFVIHLLLPFLTN